MEDSSILKVNCWNRLKYISCSLWIRIFLFNLMWTFNSNGSSEIEIERKNSMMNKLSFHWNWYFICKKIIFSTGRKEDFNQNWWFRFSSLMIWLNSSIWKESIVFNWFHSFSNCCFHHFYHFETKIWWNSLNWLFLNNFGQKEKFSLLSFFNFMIIYNIFTMKINHL